MKKIIASVGLLLSTIAFSQSYTGFLNDNYSGVHAVINNPANIVDSPYRTDINLFGLSAIGSNDFIGVKALDLLKKKDKFGDVNDFDGFKDLIREDTKRYPTSKNNGIINVDILGPSFMFNIMPKHSIAISTRARSIVNFKNVKGNLVEKFKDGVDGETAYNESTGDLKANVHAWGELGLTYASVIMDKKQHFLKGGLTLKYLQGLAYAKINTTDINVDYEPKTVSPGNTLTLSGGQLNYAHSADMESIDDFENFDLDKLKDNIATGFGGDLGFTYEWRPEIDKYTYENKDKQTVYYRDVNKYKLKVGLSVTDIGGIKYKKGKEETYNIGNEQINDNRVNSSPYKQTIENNNISDNLTHYLGAPNSPKSSITASLPTAIHFSADWNINNYFYLNLDTNFDISNDAKGNSIENTYSLTPRFEMKWISAYVPVSYRQYSGLNAGFGLRAGPLYVGSGSIFTNLLGESKGADVYLGLKIPIYQSRPKDADGDGIFNKEDKCPREAGPKENNGCPWGDKDQDNVKDNVDECTEVAGPSENNGCPWGDKDQDGVLDNVDECPELAGTTEMKGCPDTDGDGVTDNTDKCPKVKGDKDNNGCPKDTDGDGIIDTEDKCPAVVGVKEENGCPKKIIITEEAKKTINSYAKSIYFNSGKTSFRPGVTEKLDMIVEVMTEYPTANFSIEGYTDSSGSNTTNKRLSEKRARAVLDYLTGKGISSYRLKSFGFGEEMPIDTNKTRAGRANNRRVEIKLKN